MSLVFHHSDTARLPFIVDDGFLRPGANKIGGFPSPDFIWATTDCRGDSTASADRGDHYRSGKVRHVRFVFNKKHFFPWANAPIRFPQWTAEHVARLEVAALGKSDPQSWWCRDKPLPLTDCIGIETRSYRDNRWLPFDPQSEVHRVAGLGGTTWLGVDVTEKLFLSCRHRGPLGADGYEVAVMR